MNINISGNLKRLRKEKGITQEELAGFIGVSFQAVSKWERGEGYPDITILLRLLPTFFSVTLDELVGMEELRDQKRLDTVMKTVQVNYSRGRIAENVELIREELKAFPENYRLLSELACCLATLQADTDAQRENKKGGGETFRTNSRALYRFQNTQCGASQSVLLL